MTREKHIKNMEYLRTYNVDYMTLSTCLKMIAEALLFLLQDRTESESK